MRYAFCPNAFVAVWWRTNSCHWPSPVFPPLLPTLREAESCLDTDVLYELSPSSSQTLFPPSSVCFCHPYSSMSTPFSLPLPCLSCLESLLSALSGKFLSILQISVKMLSPIRAFPVHLDRDRCCCTFSPASMDPFTSQHLTHFSLIVYLLSLWTS